MATKNIITLTSIPPRFGAIGPTLRSLVEQEADIAQVYLTIPRSYNKRAFDTVTLPDLPDGVEFLRCEMDYGPATKVLPAAARFRGEDVRLIYCDDDRIYGHDWAAGLIAHNADHPGEAAAYAGDPVAALDMRVPRDTAFHRRLNALTLGLAGKRHRRAVRRVIPESGPVDIAKGYGGVLIRPEFLGEGAFDIPANFWAVDDIWLSGQLALSGVTVRKIGPDPRSRRAPSAKTDALLSLTLDGLGRDRLNLACADHFRATYGIWGGRAALQGKT